MVTQTLESSLGRRVTLSEVDSLVSVVGTWLLNACCSCSIGALIDGRLHLLEELIDVHQIILGSQVGHRWESVLVLRHWPSVSSLTIHRNHLRSSWNVLGNGSTVHHVALQSHQSLANLVIGSRVDLSALGVAKEVI